MKKTLFLAALCAFAAVALLVSAAEPTAKIGAADEVAKELAEAKAALGAAQTSLNSTQVAAEYYKVLAEKNGALLELVQTRAQLADISKQLADAQAQTASLQSRYDLEKAKVEALLKKSGKDGGVEATKSAPPSPAK